MGSDSRSEKSGRTRRSWRAIALALSIALTACADLRFVEGDSVDAHVRAPSDGGVHDAYFFLSAEVRRQLALAALQSQDSDGDGVSDFDELTGGTDAHDATDDSDVDDDGTPDTSDPDVDGDGVPNGSDLDIDGDGRPNPVDRDDDADGVIDLLDDDDDADGIPDLLDDDDDADGLPDDPIEDDEEDAGMGEAAGDAGIVLVRDAGSSTGRDAGGGSSGESDGGGDPGGESDGGTDEDTTP